MAITKDMVRALVFILQQGGAVVPDDKYLGEIVKLANAFFPKKILPKQGESLAVSLLAPKAAALAHDRVLLVPFMSKDIPEGICYFYASTQDEIIVANTMLAMFANGNQSNLEERLSSCKGSNHDPVTADSLVTDFVRYHRTHFGQSPTIYFTSDTAYKAEFPVGPQQVLTTAIENIALVDEDSLTWEQVLEFRKDTEARAKYKRLVRWIDEELKTKSPAAVQDLIAIRLDDYEWSIKKHGMKTKLGALSCVLDPKFLGATVAAGAVSAVAGGPFWAALASAGLPIGRALVSFGQSYIDSLDARRKDNYEVAYIHDIKKKAT